MLFVLAYPIGYARKLADTKGMRTYISRYARDRLNLRISKTKKAPREVMLFVLAYPIGFEPTAFRVGV